MSKASNVSKAAAMAKSRRAASKPRKVFKPLMAPGARAVQLAKEGIRWYLPDDQVVPGQIVWMPYASVIKVTHKDRHRGASDGVEVIAGKEEGSRPGRRAWNHPAIIVKYEGEKVYIVAVTSFGDRTFEEKFKDFPYRARHNMIQNIVGLAPAKAPMPASAPFQSQLTFENGAKMRRQGYVKLDTVYKLDWKDLEQWPKKHGYCVPERLQLDELSVRNLQMRLGKVQPELCSKLQLPSVPKPVHSRK